MDCHCIPYNRIPHSSTLFLDYLYHHERVAAFYNGSPFERSSYERLASEVRFPAEKRRELAAILERQNRALGAGPPTLNNIQRLAEPGTFAVVTGQQAGLFSGPAFTLYKALTTVKLAQSLTENGLPSVPVFWLATEDHDLEEVSQAAVFNEEYELVQLSDPGARPAPRSPVGAVRLTEGIAEAIGQIESHLAGAPGRERAVAILRETYSPGAKWGEAFGKLMARLFEPWGVVLLDPLDAEVHRLCAPVYRRALEQAKALRAKLLERSGALVKSGYHAQVHIAEDSTLVFGKAKGNRVPVIERNGRIRLEEDEEQSENDVMTWLKDHPLDFSPNVLLRPVVQDTLLPTLAYIAGPSELAYLGQVQVLYPEFGRPQPVLFPRAGFTLVERKVQRLLEKYKLEVTDAWQGESHLTMRIAAAGFAEGWSERFDKSEQELAALLARLRKDIERVDPTLLDTLKHTEEKMRYHIERLRAKVSRSALQRSDLLARHAQSVLRFLYPAKDLQERQVSGIFFFGRAGHELLDRLLGQIQTRSSDHQVIEY